MRRTLRLLANVKPVRYLEPGVPTGLTGVNTHPSPRSTLLYLYTTTLDKLKAAPQSSLYRQSIEALTTHRMNIVAAAEPPGHKEWQAKAAKLVEEHPEGFEMKQSGTGGLSQVVKRGGKVFMILKEDFERDPRDEALFPRFDEWQHEQSIVDDIFSKAAESDLPRGVKPNQQPLDDAKADEIIKMLDQKAHIKVEKPDLTETITTKPLPQVELEPEPQLTAEQVEEIEAKIASGLIEEVIEVAQSEMHLVDLMVKNKVWEDLEEKPVTDQWTYFDRPSP